MNWYKYWAFISRYKILHILFWTLICLNNIILYYEDDRPFFANLVDILYMIPMNAAVPFYFCAYYLTPNYLYKKKYSKLALFILLLIFQMTTFYLGFSILELYIFYNDEFYEIVTSIDYYVYFYLVIGWTYLIPILVSMALKTMSDKIRVERKFQLLQQEKINSELNFLRAQINPHFLFNVMNTIHFMISKTNTRARELVILISEMLRYQLYECKTDWAPIEKEMAYLENYLQVWQFRSHATSKIVYQNTESLSGYSVPSLLFQPILERLFIHSMEGSDSENNKIEIQINHRPGKIIDANFESINKSEIVPLHEYGADNPVFQNLYRRLKLLYNDDFLLTTSINKHHFNIKLTLSYGKD